MCALDRTHGGGPAKAPRIFEAHVVNHAGLPLARHRHALHPPGRKARRVFFPEALARDILWKALQCHWPLREMRQERRRNLLIESSQIVRRKADPGKKYARHALSDAGSLRSLDCTILATANAVHPRCTLPVTIDSPHAMRPHRSGRRFLLVLVIAIGAVLFLARTALSYWVDLLWFGSLGYSQVFWTTLRLNAGTFVVGAVVTFVLLFGGLTLLRRLYADVLPSDRVLMVNGQPVNLPLGPAVRIVAIVVSLIASLVSGSALSSDWPTLALFLQAPAGGALDATFGKPLHFYLFVLPALQLIVGWLLTLSIVLGIAAVLLALLSGGAQAIQHKQFTSGGSSPWRGISLAAVPLLLLLAANTYLGRYQLLFDRHTLFTGIDYAGAHVSLHFLLIVWFALLLGAAIAASMRRGPRAACLPRQSRRPRSATCCWGSWAGTSATSSSSPTSSSAKSPTSPTTSR